MKLYFSPGACSLASHMVLKETGLPFELVPVDLKAKTYAGGDYREVNPKGSVPCIELDNGERLTESAVVLQYLADKRPETNLMPKVGTFERYRCQEWLNYIATELHKGFGPLFKPTTPDEYKSQAKELLKSRFEFLSNRLKSNEYLLGATFSIADAYLFNILNWAPMVKVDLTPYPVLLGFMERVKSRPATRAAFKEEGLPN